MKMCRGARWRRKRQQPLGRIEEDDRYNGHAPTLHPGCPLERVKVFAYVGGLFDQHLRCHLFQLKG